MHWVVSKISKSFCLEGGSVEPSGPSQRQRKHVGGKSIEQSARSDVERKHIQGMSLGDKPGLNSSPSLGACMTLGKLQKLSEPQFPQL